MRFRYWWLSAFVWGICLDEGVTRNDDRSSGTYKNRHDPLEDDEEGGETEDDDIDDYDTSDDEEEADGSQGDGEDDDTQSYLEYDAFLGKWQRK